MIISPERSEALPVYTIVSLDVSSQQEALFMHEQRFIRGKIYNNNTTIRNQTSLD